MDSSQNVSHDRIILLIYFRLHLASTDRELQGRQIQKEHVFSYNMYIYIWYIYT
jgi:hypothetical protein